MDADRHVARGGLELYCWGFYYGVILVLEKYVWGASLDEMPPVVRHIYAGIIVLVGWVFFSARAWVFAPVSAGHDRGGAGLADAHGVFLLYTHWLLYLLAAAGASPLGNRLIHRIIRLFRGRTLRTVAASAVYMGIFLMAVAFLVTDTFNPFLYFRF